MVTQTADEEERPRARCAAEPPSPSIARTTGDANGKNCRTGPVEQIDCATIEKNNNSANETPAEPTTTGREPPNNDDQPGGRRQQLAGADKCRSNDKLAGGMSQDAQSSISLNNNNKTPPLDEPGAKAQSGRGRASGGPAEQREQQPRLLPTLSQLQARIQDQKKQRAAWMLLEQQQQQQLAGDGQLSTTSKVQAQEDRRAERQHLSADESSEQSCAERQQMSERQQSSVLVGEEELARPQTAQQRHDNSTPANSVDATTTSDLLATTDANWPVAANKTAPNPSTDCHQLSMKNAIARPWPQSESKRQESDAAQPASHQANCLLTTATNLNLVKSGRDGPHADTQLRSTNNQQDLDGGPAAALVSDGKSPVGKHCDQPVATPRSSGQQQAPELRRPTMSERLHSAAGSPASSLRDELSIQTSLVNQRIKDLSAGAHQQHEQQLTINVLGSSHQTSALSTPANSILSDSTTLITEAAMNSSELIPKLIERLDRKLIVMKDEQLTLMREIEANELTGQELFESMKQHLTVNEYEKISLHANEIEKVTKLILSLKLRLKRVECELKDRTIASKRRDAISSLKSTASPAPVKSQSEQQTSRPASEHKRPSLRVFDGSSSPIMKSSATSSSTTGTTTTSTPANRGVSDPTSTIGLPKRNHQHHASLQSAGRIETSTASAQLAQSGDEAGKPHDERHRRHEHHQTKATNSTSNDSIFDCADSAFGSTITGHGGSVANIEHPATISQSSLSSDGSSSASPSNRDSPSSQLHLSSDISVSSHSSISSVPNSPQLMSPTNCSSRASLSSASSPQNGGAPKSERSSGNNNGSDLNASSLSVVSLNQSLDSDNNNSNSNSGDSAKSTREQDPNESMMHLLTDIDILIAKRNKLMSQLEEAHQLEECIVRRNGIIVERILKKYYEDSNNFGEIASFKQYTKLKSLLLKDSHDVADRIDNAELQLTELKANK